jgi:hypothetical protein
MWVLKLVPSFCLTNSVMIASGLDALALSNDDLSTNNLAFENMGGDILLLVFHFVFWILVIIIIESRIFSCLISTSATTQSLNNQ